MMTLLSYVMEGLRGCLWEARFGHVHAGATDCLTVRRVEDGRGCFLSQSSPMGH